LLTDIAQQLEASPALDMETRADATREARLLVASVLDIAPGALTRILDRPVPHTTRDRILAAATRRARGEPMAYCTGLAAFRHLVLAVDERVLIPRPETEIVVQEALRLVASRPGGIAVDIGTGSGAIALSLASEGAFDAVVATDVSTDALAVASANVSRLPTGSAPIDFRAGADLAPLAGVVARVIVSNPPYIAFHEAAALPASVRDWEPATALFAADDGMARYDALLAGASDHLEPDGWLVLEVDMRRAQLTAQRALARGFESVRLVCDLSGRERVLLARNSPRASVFTRATSAATSVTTAASSAAAHTATIAASITAPTPASGSEAGYHARR